MNNLTYNIKLKFQTQEDKELLVQTLLEHQKVWNFMSEYTFKTKNIDKRKIHDENYHKCRKLFPNCPSQIIIRAKDSVYATYKTIKSNKKLSKISNPCKQTNLSIRLDKRLYTFQDNNKIKLTTIGKRIICNYNPYRKFEEMFKKYSVCDPLIFMKDTEICLSVSFEVPEPTFIENSYLGVDLGIKRFAVTSEGNAFIDKKFLKDKRKLRYLKRKLNSKVKTKHSHSGREKLKNLKKKEHNKNKDLCYNIANEILKTESNIIVLEDLSSLKKNNLRKDNYNKSKSSKNMLSQAPFFMLLRILKYKAPLFGKKVVTVDPSFTSQNDFRGIERGKRIGCRYYSSDGKVFDSDWNASINIAKKYKIRESEEFKHPISFREPIDGCLNIIGRQPSTCLSSVPLAGKPNDL